jgi:predicted kinase
MPALRSALAPSEIPERRLKTSILPSSLNRVDPIGYDAIMEEQVARGMELVIFVGLQASGKSAFFGERFAATHEHVSKDLFRNNRNPNRRQAQLIEAALEAGSSVVVDNTNPTVEDRLTLIELSRGFGARVVGYYFDSTVRQCVERNRRRAGKDKVPDVAIYVTASKLEHPSYSEGFDELCRVRLTDGPAFEVRTEPRG